MFLSSFISTFNLYGIVGILFVLLFITILVIIKLLIDNRRLGEWGTYPNRTLYPEFHHSPYMGIPAEKTSRRETYKYCTNCGAILSEHVCFRLGHGQSAFCENCGNQIPPL